MILLVSPRQIKYNKLCYAYILKDTREDLLMGKQSTRENKTIYQICREEAGLTRAEASEKMTAVSDSKIEKFEYEMQEPAPYDIVQMADAYHRPDLCNYYCSHKCEIGQRYVPEVEVSDLPDIILETIASLNETNPLTSRLIQIARDGKSVMTNQGFCLYQQQTGRNFSGY